MTDNTNLQLALNTATRALISELVARRESLEADLRADYDRITSTAEAEREAIIDFDSLAKQDSDDEKQAIIEFESLVEQQADVDKQAIIEFESLMRQESDAVPKVRDEPIEAEGAPKSKDTEETAKFAVLQSVANKTISKSKKVDAEILDDLKF